MNLAVSKWDVRSFHLDPRESAWHWKVLESFIPAAERVDRNTADAEPQRGASRRLLGDREVTIRGASLGGAPESPSFVKDAASLTHPATVVTWRSEPWRYDCAL